MGNEPRTRKDLVERYLSISWYSEIAKQPFSSRDEAVEHALNSGLKDGLSVTPYFFADWYLSRNPDVEKAGYNPFLHYAEFGWKEARDPNPYFDVGWYARMRQTAADPLLHYLQTGWRSLLSPSDYFDVAHYLLRNGDVKQLGLEPLIHYFNFGWREGRWPNKYFDPKYYLDSNDDVRSSGLEPLQHYRYNGAAERRNPNKYFDARWYSKACKLGRSDDPLLHFIRNSPTRDLDPGPMFHATYYRNQVPELKDRSEEPFAHFLRIGERLGFRPNADEPSGSERAYLNWKAVNAATRSRRSVLSTALKTAFGAEMHGVPEMRDADRFVEIALRKKVISFDVFDTIIERRCREPKDVFELLELEAARRRIPCTGLSDSRQEAERVARSIAGQREITIAEIYDQLGLLRNDLQHALPLLRDLELKIESRVCVAKPVGVELLRIANALGKVVVLASDTYIPRKDLTHILSSSGIKDFKKLYVSNEIGGTKHYGHLFRYMCADLSVNPEEMLHVGDNPHSDVRVPKAMGIVAVRMKKSDEQARNLAPLGAEKWEALVGGEILRRYPQNPSDESDRAALRQVGECGLGPLMLAMSFFVARQAKAQGYKRLFFMSRDGLLMQRAYEILRSRDPSLPPSAYAASSRKLCRRSAIRSFDDILAVAHVDHLPMTLEHFLRARFSLNLNNDTALKRKLPGIGFSEGLGSVISRAAADPRLSILLEHLKDSIIKQSDALRSKYRKYLETLGCDRNSAIVDIGYRGTVQKALSNVLGVPLDGIYLISWPVARELLSLGLRYSSYCEWNGEPGHDLVRFIQLYELFLSATHGTAVDLIEGPKGVTPVLSASDCSDKTISALSTVKEAALSFVDDLTRNFPELASMPLPEGAAAFKPLVSFLENPSAAFAGALQDHVFEDDFAGGTSPLAIGKSKGQTYSEAMSASVWKQGVKALWTSPVQLPSRKVHAAPEPDKSGERLLAPPHVQ